ncbi:MAG: hypothetical protein JNK89_11470 [Saprospiraceae bacterium]|nr:hypothetical protein [Saprospiraceae bacterium]
MQRYFTLLLFLGHAALGAQSIEWITPCTDKTFCLDAGSCTVGTVLLTEKAVTSCGSQFLSYSYKIDLFANGSTDIQMSGDTVHQTFPVGTHEITWRVNDNCGNVSQACKYKFTVRDCNPPNLLCLNGLTQNLEFPECEASFDLHDFILQVNDNCTPYASLKFGMKLATDTSSSFPTDTTMTFGICEQGLHVLRIYVRDGNGLTNQCNSYVLVQNNSGLCPCNVDANLSLAGCARTSDSSKLDTYTIRIEMEGTPPGGQPIFKPLQKTYQDSCYTATFADLPLNGVYTGSIRAQRGGDPLIGVSTFDLVTINKHILGQQPFTSFFQVLASDVNRSNSISTFDIIEIRKVILGIYDTFPNAPAWRFILPMPDTNLTAFAAVRDSYAFQLPNLMADTTLKGFNFVAIKTGDANQNATLQTPDLDDRSGNTPPLLLRAGSTQLQAGETRWIPFFPAEDLALDGWQLALHADPERLQMLDLRGPRPQDALITPEGELRIACVFDAPQQLDREKPLFEVLYAATEAINLTEALSLSGNRLRPEVYPASQEASRRAVVLDFEKKGGEPTARVFAPRPNPFAEQTVLDVQLSSAQGLEIEIFDQKGERVYRVQYDLAAGLHNLVIPGSALPAPGVWMYRVVAGTAVQIGRLVRF